MNEIEFRILGPVEAWVGRERVSLGSRKQRFVLAVLLLEANRLVPLNRLVDLVWEDQDVPASARASIQTLISRLRTSFRQFGDDAPEIVGRGAGYVLRVDPLSVDAHRFTDLVARAASCADEPAVELFDQALALWRGDALGEVVSRDVADRLCGHLHEGRWAALESRVDALLRLGRSRQLLAELTGLVAEHALRQRLVGQLMLALYREGRTADALATYHTLRTRLTDELGLDPVPELRRLESAILRADPALDHAPGQSRRRTSPEPVRPAQLPHDALGFVGRTGELNRLDAGLTSPSGTKLWVISGIAGVGKTALAVHWAHRNRGRFPGGQLYLDLRGFDAEHEPLTPAAALIQMLTGLGADPRLIPADVDGRAALFRSMLADEHVLLVLDNVRDTGQVITLIPPVGTVVVTSRQRLGDLIARTGAQALPLSVLPAADSRRLLEVALGVDQVAAEAMAAERLAQLCGHLPLALRIAVANVGADPESEIAGLVQDLAEGDPLAGLTVDGAEESAITKAFALSYKALPTEHRLLFRRLGLLPGQTFTALPASVVSGLPPARTERLMKALVAAHLVEQYARGRFRFHDLLRQYAVDRALTEDTTAEREQARRLVLDHYLHTADAAGRRLVPQFLRLPRELPDGIAFTDNPSALSWLDAEWPNLAAAVDQVAERGPRPLAWHIADALRAFFHYRGHHTEWANMATAALDVARAEGDERAQAAMHQSISLAYVNTGRYEEARAHLVSALRRNVADGWHEGRAAVLNNLSAVHQRLGNPRASIDCGLQSLRLSRQLGQSGGTVMALANLGFAYWQLGVLDQSLGHFGPALETAEREGIRYSVAVLLVDLGNVHRDLGHRDTAEEFYTRALVANRELGYSYGEATALSGRALLHCQTGPSAQTRSDARSAVELTRQIGDHGTEAWALISLGDVCLRLGLAAEASEHHGQALEIARATSFRWCEADALRGSAEALLDLGDLAGARAQGGKAVELARRSGYRLIEARALRTLAEARPG
ncbi:AfsR/SARP family transcriptional regulator [Plantactinospora soyae]|uniref:DNA-binding SARP family transcriptional activator/tetratricopeptide (TPR) repeat protein n=1 Tax=Plantactinospora soyae TaxID=1544732 RepID=A0A927M9L5_9ACTN|nr:BTAD domain-containing putative transcriptional regulator [Plantactinospora soyae]MBE1489470.1 DNA-binding SARP family transcriptional activator/tetratricopeptide (TPR) repeat protein [Plantactinospora soyae]